MMKLTRFAVCALLLVLLMLIAGCVTDEDSTVKAGPVLRVGVTANYPPIIYKSHGKYAGVEADLARKLAQRLNARLVFVDMPFDQLLTALNADKIDIVMSGMTVTALREPLAQFCTSYATTGQALLVRDASLWTYSYPEVIYSIKTRIGVEKGTIADALVQRQCPQAKVSTYSSPEAATRALKSNHIDVVMADAPVIWNIGAENIGQGVVPVRKLLTHENLAWAVRRGDSEMYNLANAAIQQWRTDGTLAGIIHTYMPRAQ